MIDEDGVTPYSPAQCRSKTDVEWVCIERPPGEIEVYNSSVYDILPCETALRGLCICSQCPEEKGYACENITHAKVFFENNPNMYWEYKTAAIIDDVYKILIFYKSNAELRGAV